MDAECEKRLVRQITKQVSNVLARPDASSEDKKKAYEQLLGIRWSKPLIKEVSPHMLSGLVRRGLYNPATTQMATTLRNGLSEIWRSIGGEVDADSGSWWSFIEKHGLTNEASRQGWDETITQMQDWLIYNPSDLAGTRWDFMEEALKNAEHRQLALKLWLTATAKDPAATDMRRKELLLSLGNPKSAFEVADLVAGGSVNESCLGKAHLDAARNAGLEADEALQGGPRAKMAKVAARADSVEGILRFEATAGRTNVMRSCELSLKSVASGIRCWGTFCELTGREHFPPTEEGVLAWSAYFSGGRTFQMYLPHLEKACVLVGHDLSWKTKAVVQAARGLAKAGDRIHEPKPAVSRALFSRMISRCPLDDAMIQAIWISWLFLLRVPSECLPLVRQKPFERMDPDSVLQSPAVIGLEKDCLVIKLHRRKHMAGGARMVRGCICDRYPPGSLEIHVPQLFCPTCVLWGAICRRVRAGQMLFPGLTGPLFTDKLRRMARSLGYEKAERLGSHSIRRGAARAILEAGGSFAQLLKAGQWHSSAFRLYLDLGVEEKKAMAEVLIEHSDEEAPGIPRGDERDGDEGNPIP